MKKLLTILGAVGLTATTGATVVACGNESPKVEKTDYQALFKDAITVKLGSFTDSLDSGFTPKDKNGGNQNQWGENSLGALYASLWAVNNHNESYPYVNKKVAEVLIKGESITRRDAEGNEDTGKNITIDGKALEVKEGQDWHTIKVVENQEIKFNVEILTYKKDKDKKVIVDTTHRVTITVKLVKTVKVDMELSKITIQGKSEFGREIYNYDNLQNLKANLEMIVSPYAESLIKVELKDKQLFITAPSVNYIINGRIILTADNINTTVIDLSVLKDSEPSTF